MRANGSGAARWWSRLWTSILIIPDGTGFPPVLQCYRKRDYHGALDFALKVNLPGFWRTNVALAACYGQLGEREAAGKALQDLLVLRREFATGAREELAKWWEPEFVEHLLDGLRKAGLEIASKQSSAPRRARS